MNQFNDLINIGIAAVLMLMSAAAPTVGQESGRDIAPDFFLKDLEGNAHALAEYEGKYVVLEWLNFRCHTVDEQYKNGYLPDLQAEYAEKEVVWLSIVSGDAAETYPEKLARQVEKRMGQQQAVLLDVSGEVGRIYGVERTPQVFLIDPDGSLIYEGALDNKPVVEDEPEEPFINYLEKAYQEAERGQTVQIVSTAPYGCPLNP